MHKNKTKEPLFHIAKRAALPWYLSWAIRIGAIVLALVACAALTVFLTHENPFQVYATMFRGAFSTPRRIWNLLQSLAMLLCVSLALTPAFKMRFWNIGGEGQVLIGGLATAACMICLGGKIPNALLILTMIVASMLAGAIWALIPAFFKAQYNTNETLFTLMMNYVAIQLVRWQPLSSSSGIPQITGEIRGHLDAPWWQVLLAKIAGGTLSILSGLSLGREGPSIQLGGMAAKGIAKVTKADKTTQLRMISCGGGAGLAAAFNAPLAGMMFTLEEIHKTLDGNILCMGIVSTITADYISKLFFGQNTVFHYTTADIPLKSYWILLLLGIVLGLAGVGYNALMLLGQKWVGKIKAPVRMMLVFVCSGVLGLFVPQLLGGGHTMVTLLLQEHPTIKILILLLLGKFLFSLLSFASGAPGGIFFPLLILGTYLGAIYAEAAIAWFGLAPELWQELVVVSMAGFFAAIVRAPMTGIILVFEMTGNLDSLLPLAVVSLTSYTLADLLGSTPIYTALLENLLRPEDKAAARRNRPGEKVLKTYVLPLGSALDGKCIKDIDWGRHCLIVSIERGDTAVTPKGDTTLHAGDTLVVMVSQRRFARDNDRLEALIDPKS